jgi:hypothetical protein
MKPSIDKQISAYLSESLGESETTELLAWVAEDVQHADHFARCCALDELGRELVAEGRTHASPANSIKSLTHYRTLLALAAAVMLVVAGWVLWSREPPHYDTFAFVSQAVAARDRQGVPIPTGTRFGAEQLEIQRGLIRIDFDHGASMTLEGPAKVELHDAMHAYFHYGVATFQVPEAAKGFTVDTADADVVDLGTAFGLSRHPEGETNVCVFEGEVEVRGQKVQEGQAVRARRGSDVERRDYETTRYEKVWPVTSGVLQTTGMIKFVPPGPDLIPGKFEDNEHITIFLERQQVRLAVPLEVDLADPGEYRRFRHSNGPVIAAETRVRSYLLQLDPIGALDKHDLAKPRAQGQVTFDRPILGLIASSNKLASTDPLLGHPHADYGKLPRGIEPPKRTQVDAPGRDIVILAADQRTLILNFSAGSAVDQIRVLVEE